MGRNDFLHMPTWSRSYAGAAMPAKNGKKFPKGAFQGGQNIVNYMAKAPVTDLFPAHRMYGGNTMIWYGILAALAAYGLVCALWSVGGWLLSGGRTVVVCFCESEKQVWLGRRRCRFLRDSGLVRRAIVVAAPEVIPPELAQVPDETEFCSPEELSSRLGTERKHIG